MERELSEQEKDWLYFKWRYKWCYWNFKITRRFWVLIEGVTETVKHELKKRGAFLTPLPASLVQPVISSVVKGISGRGVRRTRRGDLDENF